MREKKYRVLDRDLQIVTAGETVTDFRGEPGTFEGVTRGPEGGRTPKVLVDGREYNATVWDLTVAVEATVKEPRDRGAEETTPLRPIDAEGRTEWKDPKTNET